MAEDPLSDPATVVGLSKDDITPHIYEGGFKTWECSIDLADYVLAMLCKERKPYQKFHHFIEVITL